MTFTHDFSRRIGKHDFQTQDTTQTQWSKRSAHTHAMIQEEAMRGVPTNIVVHRIRTDVFWEDVVSTAGHPVRQFHNGLSPALLPSLLFSLSTSSLCFSPFLMPILCIT